MFVDRLVKTGLCLTKQAGRVVTHLDDCQMGTVLEADELYQECQRCI